MVASPENDERPGHRDDRRFAERVRDLRDDWSDMRDMAAMLQHDDRPSQFRALLKVYDWCVDAVADIRRAYGSAAVAGISPPPEESGAEPGFEVSVNTAHRFGAWLTRVRGSQDRWHIHVALMFPESQTWLPAARGHQVNYWTRRRIDDILLSLLSAFERSRMPPRLAH